MLVNLPHDSTDSMMIKRRHPLFLRVAGDAIKKIYLTKLLKTRTLENLEGYIYCKRNMKKKKIILHDQQYAIGGPKGVLDGIVNSYLGEKYEFVRLAQPESCGFNPIKAISFILKYRSKINQEHADAIYICGLQYIGLLMVIAARLSNVKKVCLSVHGSEWDYSNGTFRKWILMHIIEPLEVRLAHSVFTVCDAAQRTIGSLKYAKKSCNDGVVYNTFPNFDYETIKQGKLRQELRLPDDKIIVTTVGRVVKDKGHADIIEAIKQNTDDRFVYVIVGNGPYVDEYKRLCEKEITEKKLFLLGLRTDVKEILKDTDIFLFATYHENHSLALLEAVNMKCAALVTNIGGNPEIIEHMVSGHIIPPKDSNAIVDGLLKLSNKVLRKEYTEKAYSVAKEKFSVENTYGKLEQIFVSDIN